MAKKITPGNKAPTKGKDIQNTSIPNTPKTSIPSTQIWPGIMITAAFFFILSLAGSLDNIVEKWTGLLAAIIIFVILLIKNQSSKLKYFITPLFFSVIAYIVWGGVSTFYAASSKFAIFEFSKLLVALCVYLLVLFFTDPSEAGFKKVSYILASTGSIFGFLSVDAASFGVLSNIFKAIMGVFTPAYTQNGAFEQGIRITTITGNPNTYAGFMALAVILSLYLVISASNKRAFRFSAALLAINALSYLLAFSLGSLFMFIVACLIMIGISEKGMRISLFILMLETAVITFIFAFISIFGLGRTGAVSIVPNLALILNAVVLCFLDGYLRPILNVKMGGNARLLVGVILGIIILLAGYGIAAFTVSGDMTLNAEQTTMRGVYAPGGDYTLSVESTAPVSIVIESQNKYNLMIRNSTVLFRGTNEKPVSFTVPEDSKIVKVSFISGAGGAVITKAHYSGAAEGDIHLNYPLLPNIIANRLQDLFANENLIQRTVFFEDGMKLFEKSPIIGRGLGGFENGVYSVQNFHYETKYAHNHYIQALSDLGIVGLVLFLSVLGFSVFSVVQARRKSISLFAVPALAACTFQMFGQALSDAIWSTGIFLGFAGAVLALITIFFSEPIRRKESAGSETFGKVNKIALAVFSAIFVLLLSGNLYSQAHARAGVEDFNEIKRLIMMDRFEYNDYKLSYIVNAPKVKDKDVKNQADIYANDLAKVESNSLTPYIVAYKFENYLDYDAFQVARQGIRNNMSNPAAWMQIFDVFEKYIDPVGPKMDDAADRLKDSKTYVEGVLGLYDELQKRNKNSLDDVKLSPYNDAFIGKLLEIRATHLYTIDWTFTAIMTYAFDSACAVDADQDGLPDDMTVSSGSAQGKNLGVIAVTDNTILDFNLYHKLHGKYTFKVETDTPQGIRMSYNGQEMPVAYDKRSASVVIDLADNTDRALSKFTVAFPAAADINAVTFTTVLE